MLMNFLVSCVVCRCTYSYPAQTAYLEQEKLSKMRNKAFVRVVATDACSLKRGLAVASSLGGYREESRGNEPFRTE